MATIIALSSLPIDFTGLPMPNQATSAVGIDLGTTNSVVALGRWNPADPTSISVTCLEVEQPTADLGSHIGTLVPSVVARRGDRLFVGEGAKRIVANSGALGMLRNRDVFFETKNEIGTDRRYPRAPEGFRSPGEIGGHILRYLMAAAAETELRSIVVTVPASFQTAQRDETFAAAAHAGFDLLRTQLFDEPLSAFLDFLAGNPTDIAIAQGGACNLLVFDFGGGTCDIALLTLSRSVATQGLEVAARSVSRFHRLGGGDIDAAIVYDVLLPQLLDQNQLPALAFGYAEKRNQLEPALRPIAEGLKIGLCQEQARRQRLGLAPDPNLRRQFPGRHNVRVNDRTLSLTNPALTSEAFAAVLSPFIDRNMLAPRSDEYRTSRSIFAPVDDAIERSGFRHDEIDVCLMVGGSSGIPQIAEALRAAMPKARVVGYEDPTARKECVARGAAIAATVQAVMGRRILTPVCNDEIAMRTQDGVRPLVARGHALPWPVDGEAELTGLQAPRASDLGPLDLRVEVVAVSDGRTLFKALWPLQPPVRKGEPLVIRYQFDANQVMRLRLLRPERRDQPETQLWIENPLTNVQNPLLKEIEAERLERQIGGGALDPRAREEKALQLASLLDEIGQREKAFAILRSIQAGQRGPDAVLLNRMALILESLGDQQEACRLFEQAADAGRDWGGALFNLALNLRTRGRTPDAITAIERALHRDATGPYHTLRALLAGDTKDETRRQGSLAAARASWPAPRSMSNWMLTWYRFWADQCGEQAAIRAVEEERRRRRIDIDKEALLDAGVLPAEFGVGI